MTKTAWIYVDTNHQVGHPDHLKVFGNPDAADAWFMEHDPEGVVFGYPVIGDFDVTGPPRPAAAADRGSIPKAEQ